MTPARFRWGLLFIMVGVLLLLVNADILHPDFILDFFFFIPLLLIAIGIEKIFAKTRLQVLSYLSSVLLVGGVLWMAFQTSSYSEGSSFFESDSFSFEADEPVDIINAVFKLDNASLTIRSATHELFYARFDEWSHKPRSSMEVVDGRAEINLTARGGRTRRVWGGAVEVNIDESEDWRIKFSKDVPLLLKCVGQDGDIHLNLGTTPLRELTLDLNDADIYVKLGILEPKVRVNINGYDSKLRLRIPQEAGLSVTGIDDPDYLEEIGLIRQAGAFVTDGFGDCETQVFVDLDDRFRSLSIDFY